MIRPVHFSHSQLFINIRRQVSAADWDIPEGLISERGDRRGADSTRKKRAKNSEEADGTGRINSIFTGIVLSKRKIPLPLLRRRGISSAG